MKPIAILSAAAGLVLTWGVTAQAITIDMVTVGDAGNAADTTGYGAVAYEYRIATTEVNLFQYTAFLNAVAKTDLYGLYNTNMGSNGNIAGISRSGESGSYTYAVSGSGDRPVTYVSWFDAARFANWVANGQPTGAQAAGTTEDGAYTLNGATSGVGFTKNAINPNTGTTTTYWIPSEDEWYKAAYYQPVGAGGPSDSYWLYPTASDSAPGNTIGSGVNQANYYAGDYAVTQSSSYSSSQNYLTDGGAFSNSSSYYGTFDQGGNVWEWNDAVIGSSRGLRGGSWDSNESSLRSSTRYIDTPSFEADFAGFRVASVPEPSAALLMILGGAALLARRARKNTL
jgi:sulfatase modifying factor 1